MAIGFAYGAEPAQPILGRVGHALTETPRTSHLNIDPQLRSLGTPTPAWCEWLSVNDPAAVVHRGSWQAVRYAHTDACLFAVVEINEAQGLCHAAATAYRQVQDCNAALGFPHTLRIWNYLDDINLGADDEERYKQFCVGRAQQWTTLNDSYPAATAIGRKQSTGMLQVFWLASRNAGLTIENPRQLSAWQYPRQYGPASPGFARACLVADGPLLISGTASIVGHESQHVGDVRAQLHETLDNLAALIGNARTAAPHLSAQLDASSLIKMYVRHGEHAALLQQEFRQRCGAAPALHLMHADVCRSELLVEMDCVHGLSTAQTS